MTDLVEVRCRGCLRKVGITPSNVRIYHDEICAIGPDPTRNEDRDDLMEAIFHYEHWSVTMLGRFFEVTRQRADQVIAHRRFE